MNNQDNNVFENILAGVYDNKLPYNTTDRLFSPVFRKIHREEDHRIELQFKADALEYCGLTAHPRADKAYELANSYARDRREIVDCLRDLADLLLG